MKKFFVMIAAVAMAGIMSSCGEKSAAGGNADSTQVEAAAEPAASDKPMADQLKDAVAMMKKACEEKDVAGVEAALKAYAAGLSGATSMEEIMALSENPDFDIAKAGLNDLEKWATPEDIEKLKPAGEEMEKAMEEAMKKFIAAPAGEEAPAEEPAQ